MERHDQREAGKINEPQVDTNENRGSMLDESLMGTNIQPTPQVRREERDEEVASEIGHVELERAEQVEEQASSLPGWIAVALSILSFFMMPIILGGAGILVGFIARNRDSEWLGNTAIAAGIVSILITLFVRPYVS